MKWAWLVVTLSLWVVEVRAEAATDKQKEIMRTVMASDGWITEQMHQEYWDEFPAAVLSTPEYKKMLGEFLDKELGDAEIFQRETWQSVKLSLQAHRVVYTQGFQASKGSASSSPIIRNSGSVAEADRDAELLINAAATGAPVQGPSGPFYITDELVTQTIASLDLSFCREEKLANPQWQANSIETVYPYARIRIVSDCLFVPEFLKMTDFSGQQRRTIILGHVLSETVRLSVSFSERSGAFANPQISVQNIAKSAMSGLGITSYTPIVSTWRGRVSCEEAGSVTTSVGPIYASVRAVDGGDVNGAWGFLAIGSNSMLDVLSARQALETSSQLIDR